MITAALVISTVIILLNYEMQEHPGVGMSIALFNTLAALRLYEVL